MLPSLVMIFILFFLSTFAFAQAQEEFSIRIENKNLNYLIYTPSKVMKSYPLLIYLHGRGEVASFDSPHPQDFKKLRKHGPPKLIDIKNWDQNLPFIVLSIQCFKNCAYHEPKYISHILEMIKQKYSIDKSKIYMMGNSMGGNGVMRYVNAYPNSIAASIVICGYGNYNWSQSPHTAWWGISNRYDDIVPLINTLKIYANLRSHKRHARTRLTILEETGHDSWTSTYNLSNNLGIYSFLLNHALPSQK